MWFWSPCKAKSSKASSLKSVTASASSRSDTALLASDDAMSFMAYADCALLIAASGITSVRNLEDCERQLSEIIPLAGVILNKYDLRSESYSYYEYDYM